MDILFLHKAAADLRKAYEEIRTKNPKSGLLKCFPRGGCTGSTIALAYHLKENCGVSPVRISSCWNGEDDERRPHAWLIVDGEIDIDISADQFPEISESVIVCKNSFWHRRFKNFGIYDYDATMHTSETWKEEHVFPVFEYLSAILLP